VPRTLTTVVVVGLGRAGGFSIEAFERLPSVEVVAGVDPKGPEAWASLLGRPIYASVHDLPSQLGPDLLVVATPTESHVAVCLEVLDRHLQPRSILCEKPLTPSFSEARRLFERAARAGVRLQTLYHFAFSPEVIWAWQRWPAIQRAHGPINSFAARFDDPKPDLAHASSTLLSSWVDAGINAMSVLGRFLTLEAVADASAGAPASCSARVRFRSGAHTGLGSISTDWQAPRVDKTTELELADGTTLILDHVARTAELAGDAERADFSQNDPPALDRYRTMLRAHLTGDASVYAADVSLRLHALLADGDRRNREHAPPVYTHR
jgi:predicted dehydrogenase